MMRFALFLIPLTAFAEIAFPVVPLQWTPDQIAQSLRLAKPAMPAPDCAALQIQACRAGALEPVRDLSLHWIQLDDDPELEAILIAEAKAEWNFFAYIFDWNKQWNLVGALPCHRRCDAQEFIRVRQLTTDSPALLIANRDDGGPDHVILMALGYQLRQGKLWPVFEWKRRLAGPTRDVALHATEDGTRLLFHTVTVEPLHTPPKHACHVLRWHSQTYTFVKDPAAAPKYCDVRTGRPKPSSAHPIRLPADPY